VAQERLSIGGLIVDNCSVTSETSVLIIGAGAAGLSAARDLSAAGIEVIVLEARDRIGGRIHTSRHNSSIIPIEFGAEFVHGKHAQLLKIIEASGAPLCDVTDRHWYFENGVRSRSNDFWNKLTALMALMNPDQPDRSLQDFLDSLPADEETRRAKAVATRYVQGFDAADVRRIGVHGLIKENEAEDEIDGDRSFRVLGGYDIVAETLRKQAEAQGTVIHLNTIVKEIHWTSNRVEAVCSSGNQAVKVPASCAVITLPLGVLQAKPGEAGAVRFVPELPEEKHDSIRGVAMGHVVRITLRFRERFWEELDLPEIGGREDLSQLGFIHYPEATIPTWWTLLPIRAPMLVGWVGGPNADRFTGHDEAYMTEHALISLKQILGVSEERLRAVLLATHAHDWNSDPFTRGAYAYLPVNGLEAQQALAEPLDSTLFFAGEATSVGHIGTVHGAVESGQRVAKEILGMRSR
jgi:monoamine oxidase